MIAAWVGVARATTGCDADTSAAVDETIEALMVAYEVVDETAFDRSQKNLVAAVACLDEVPTGAQVARLHQAMALSAFVNGQTKATRRALAAARLMDPAWKLDEGLFPPSHPFVDLFTAASNPGPTQDLGAIDPEAWIVDGHDTSMAPLERGFLLQVRQDSVIVWSGYMFDWVEVPDRGQAPEVRSVLATPHQVWLGVGAVGRTLSSRQESEGPGWADQDDSAAGGGVSVIGRLTPLSVVGGEVAGSIVSSVDPVAGGGWQPSGSFVLVGGGGGWVGDVTQPHAGVRLGAAVDRIRAWPDDGNPVPSPLVSTVGSAVVGLEAGVRAENWRADGAFDALIAEFSELYQMRGRLDGGALVAGPVAVEGLFELRTGGLEYTDGPRVAGTRADTDIRVGVGIGVWR